MQTLRFGLPKLEDTERIVPLTLPILVLSFRVPRHHLQLNPGTTPSRTSPTPHTPGQL